MGEIKDNFIKKLDNSNCGVKFKMEQLNLQLKNVD